VSVFSAACRHLALLCCVYILSRAFMIDLMDVQLHGADGMVFFVMSCAKYSHEGKDKG